jgi:hypothetical protein
VEQRHQGEDYPGHQKICFPVVHGAIVSPYRQLHQIEFLLALA